MSRVRVRGRWAVVTLAALDLRRRPDHRAELGSQLLLGEVVRVSGASRDAQWLSVENVADGYRGWVRSWGIVPCGEVRARRWFLRARGRVTVAYAEVRTGRGSGALVSPVCWNGRVIVGPSRAGYRRAELPDGRRGWIESRAISTRRSPGISLVGRVRSLLGVPYLWGGRTPMGFDCSALVQQILVEQGVGLPRDADQQFHATDSLPDGAIPNPGDLLFFGAGNGRLQHVGLALGGAYYAHSRGRVRINSIEPGNALFDKALREQLRSVRRLRNPAGSLQIVRDWA